MIDRRTALACAALIALMLALAAWQIITQDHWTTLAVQDGHPLPPLMLLLFPACSALVVGAMCWHGRSAGVDEAKARPRVQAGGSTERG